MLSPRVTDLGSEVRLDWTPDLTGQGYRFYIDGHAVSRTFNAAQSSAKFRKPDDLPHDYGLRLMAEVGSLEAARFPIPEPPAGGGELPFGEPQLSSPVLVTVPNVTDFVLPASTVGKDVICDYGGREGVVRQGGLIMDNAAGAPRRILHRNYHARCTKPFDSSGYRSGGVRFQTHAQEAWVLDLYDEKHFAGATGIDGIGIASAPHTVWTVQRCLLEGAPDSSAPGGQHIDCLQLQGPLAKLRVGLCSMELSGVRPGNDPGKGLQLAEEPWGVGETPFAVELEKLDVECLGNPATGARYGVLLVQEYARDTIRLGSEIFWQRAAALDSLGDNFAVTLYTNGRPGDYGTVSGSRPNRVLTAKASSGITGAVRERPSGSPKFVTREMLGM